MEESQRPFFINYKEQPASLEVVAELASKLEELFDQPDVPHLLFPGATDPDRRFVILENQATNSQVAIIIANGLNDFLKPPFRIFIRLLERDKRTLTRAIYTFGHRDTISNDFDRDESINNERVLALNGKTTLEINLQEPAWYDPSFLETVVMTLREAEVNEELQQEVINYSLTERLPHAQRLI